MENEGDRQLTDHLWMNEEAFEAGHYQEAFIWKDSDGDEYTKFSEFAEEAVVELIEKFVEEENELPESRIIRFRRLQDEQFEVFQKKNRDYGDSFANDGVVGVLVRLGDKISRAKKVSSTGINLVADETLRDTLQDLATYSLLAILLTDENAEFLAALDAGENKEEK